jgi:hypothetical protein
MNDVATLVALSVGLVLAVAAGLTIIVNQLRTDMRRRRGELYRQRGPS